MSTGLPFVCAVSLSRRAGAFPMDTFWSAAPEISRAGFRLRARRSGKVSRAGHGRPAAFRPGAGLLCARVSAECGEQLPGPWVWLVPPGEPGADVADEPRGDLEGAHLRTAGEGEAGHQGDADAGADQGAHEAVVAGAAGDLGTETAEGGEHVGGSADIAPAVDPAFARDLGQAGS